MKKLYFSLAMLAMVFSVSAQDTLKPIGWITYPTATDWATTPVTKNCVTIAKAPVDWTFDENSFDLATFWTATGLGAENQIKNQTLADGGLSYSSSSFGAKWKAWYDAEALYLGVKFIDKNILAATGSREIEIMYQTKYKDRFEPGWKAAKSQIAKNWQYARYAKLGGQKTHIVDPGSYTGSFTNIGDGTMTETDAIIGANPPIIIWTVDPNNVAWITVRLSFADHLFYLDDITAPAEGANMIALDPTIKDTISWDVKANALDGTAKDQWFWNSTLNDGFEAIYYNGYLKFGDQVITAVGKNYVLPSVNVFLAGDMLKIQGLDKGNLKVYSVIGQLVKSANSVKELNISDLTQGVYLVKLNDLSQSFKVVKR